MYAIIRDGSRQLKVTEGQELSIDYRDLGVGDELKFDQVLAVADGDDFKLGTPLVSGAGVTAEVLGVEIGKKISIRKFRRRKDSQTRRGHRQTYTKIRINKITV
jgi:large subunit ribosomal protein L21